jgi:hypothetical protein
MLDGEGGYTVYGKLFPAEKSTGLGSLPLGLAHNVKLLRPIKAGQSLTYADVAMDESLTAGEAAPRDGARLRAGRVEDRRAVGLRPHCHTRQRINRGAMIAPFALGERARIRGRDG